MSGVAASILAWITRLESVVAGAALVLAALALSVDVVARNFFGTGFFGVQKLAVYCCTIAALIGFSLVVHSGGHLRVAAIDGAFPPAWRHLVARIGDALSAAACLFLAYFAFRFVSDTRHFREVDTILNFELWKIQMAIPVVFVVAAIKYSLHAAFPGTKPGESQI